MRKILILLTLALLITVPAFAQDAAYEYPTIDVSAIGALLTNSVSGLLMAAFGGAPVTLVLVSLLKRVPVLDRFTGEQLTIGTAGFLYIGAIVASLTGFTPQFHSLLDLITSAAPAVVSFIATLGGASALYSKAKAQGVPLIGADRTYLKYGYRSE